jgi:hypothetical protein
MASTTTWAPRAPARSPLAAVVLLHLLMLGLWWAATQRALPGPPRAEQRPLLLRWLSRPAPTAAVAAPRSERQPPATRVPRPQHPPEPAPITVPGAAVPTTAQQPAAPAPAVAASSPAAPLDLRLPTGPSAAWRQRHPALDDPRANTPRLTLEQKLEQALGGDGQWREERVDNDRVVFRRGSECIVATRSRAGQLELAGGAFRNLWSVRGC